MQSINGMKVEIKQMERSELRGIAEAIVQDYNHGRVIDKLELTSPLDREAILQVLEKLFGIVYMGYYRDRELKLYDPASGLTVMIEDCMFRLQKQIRAVLPFKPAFADAQDDVLIAESNRITLEFFRRIPAIREVLDTDLQAILDGDPAATCKDEIVYAYPGFYAITVNRLAHELWLLDVPMIPRIMSEHAHNRTGIDIHPGATIGRSFMIDHGTGIVIGETTTIGEHVKLYQGVTLGALSTSGGQALQGKKRHPTVEDRVTIYSNASILGNTVIGHDSVIGGNVFITEDVPAGMRVSLSKQEQDVKPRRR